MRKPDRMQFEFEDLSVNEIMRDEDFYRPLLETVDFVKLMKPYREIYSNLGRGAYGIETGIKCLLAQIFEDRSDRQMEKMIKYDLRLRYFCGFGLSDKTPDHSWFCRFRERLGTENIEKIHNHIVKVLRDRGLVTDFCSFIDTSEIIRKQNTWIERDKRIQAELDKQNLGGKTFEGEPLKKKSELKNEKGLLSNKNVALYSADPDARIGCKGNENFWFGYKRGVCVDGTFGIITRVLVEPGNVNDWDMAAPLLPDTGAVLMDKGFDVNRVYENAPADVTLRIIKKRNRKDKNRDFDRWISKLRSPFESVFSQQKKMTRFAGIARNKFKGFIEAVAFNIKKALKAKEQYSVKLSNLCIA